MNTNNNGELFEDNIVLIEKIIQLHISKYKLAHSIPSVGVEDVVSQIKIHIWKKWSKYDQSRPLNRWLTTVCCNFLKNLQRDLYYKNAKPCIALRCEAFGGGENCKLYGTTCGDCAIYRNWELTKKYAHDICMPVTIEDQQNQASLNSLPFDEIDFNDQLEDLKIKLQTKLSRNDYKIFLGLYIENKSEADLSKELGYKINTKTEVNRQIKNVKANIISIVKKILIEEE